MGHAQPLLGGPIDTLSQMVISRSEIAFRIFPGCVAQVSFYKCLGSGGPGLRTQEVSITTEMSETRNLFKLQNTSFTIINRNTGH